jgi:hypothetical protein
MEMRILYATDGGQAAQVPHSSRTGVLIVNQAGQDGRSGWLWQTMDPRTLV